MVDIDTPDVSRDGPSGDLDVADLGDVDAEPSDALRDEADLDEDDSLDSVSDVGEVGDVLENPCLYVSESVVFPETTVGRTSRAQLSVLSQCPVPVRVFDPRILLGMPVFRVDESDDGEVTLGPWDQTRFDVVFEPPGPGELRGAARLSWSQGEAESGDYEISLLGTGVANQCPVASFECRGDPQPLDYTSTEELCVGQTTILFCRSTSTDEDGIVTGFDWQIGPIEGTDPDEGLFLRSPRPGEVYFQARIAGQYALELAVEDDLGLASCNVARMLLTVMSGCL